MRRRRLVQGISLHSPLPPTLSLSRSLSLSLSLSAIVSPSFLGKSEVAYPATCEYQSFVPWKRTQNVVYNREFRMKLLIDRINGEREKEREERSRKKQKKNS